VAALDGPLHLVTLDALPYGGGLVGERWTVELQATLSEITEPRSRGGGGGSLLLVGGVDTASAFPIDLASQGLRREPAHA
jgi:hypothetical protein